MRNPSSLCAVALSFALTVPASAAPAPQQGPATVTFNRADWDVVIPAPNALIDADVHQLCGDGGTLASRRADVDASDHNGWTRAGVNTSIPFSCVKLAGGHASISPISREDMELTVSYPVFAKTPSYVLSRGPNLRHNPTQNGFFIESAEVRAPKGTELTDVAPPAPPPPATHVPTHKPHHKKPGHPVPATLLVFTVAERAWLTVDERDDYDAAIAPMLKVKPIKADDVAGLDKTTRAEVRDNLRDDAARNGYDAALASNSPKQLATFFASPAARHYSGDEIKLTPAERAQLGKVAASDDKGFRDAGEAYDTAMSSMLLKAKGSNPDDVHVDLHQIVTIYRAMLSKPKPGQGGADSMTLDQFNKLPLAQQQAFCATAKTANPPPSADVAAACAKLLNNGATGTAGGTGASGPAGGGSAPVIPADYQHIRTASDVHLLDGDHAAQKKFCDMVAAAKADSAGNSCGDNITNGDAVGAMSHGPVGSDTATQTAALQTMSRNLGGVNSTCNNAAPDKAGPTAAVSDECARLEKAWGITVGQTKPTALDGNAPPSPGGDTCKDKDGKVKPCTPAAEKPDPTFWQNVSNGLGFGLAGLLMASFFGGPLLMLAVAVAAGAGGYFFSKSINNPAPPPPGTPPKS